MNSYSSSLPTLLRSLFDNNPPRENYDVDYFSNTDEFGPLPELIDSVPPSEREYFENA